MSSPAGGQGAPLLLLLTLLVLMTSWRLVDCKDCRSPNQKTNSFLWTVRRDPSPPAYLFGTIHVPYTKVWTHIPENAKKAFFRADTVQFELDLTDAYTLAALATCQLLPHGQNLSKILPQNLYRRLENHMEYIRQKIPFWITDEQRRRGIYAEYMFRALTGNWHRKRPVWVMLMVNSLTRGEIQARGTPVLDLYLAQQAARMGKRTGAVERVEEQCVPLNELEFSQVLFALNRTLTQLEQQRRADGAVESGLGQRPGPGQGQGPSARPGPAARPRHTAEDLIHHYNCGDLSDVIYSLDTAQVPSFEASSLAPVDRALARGLDSYFRRELIVRRNRRMAARIQQLLMREPKSSFFFALGAGHFLGNNSVIDRLRQAGLTVQHTAATDDVFVGPGYKRRKLTFPDVSNQFSMPAAILRGPLDVIDAGTVGGGRKKHRHRHGHRNHRGRRKNVRNKKKHSSSELGGPTDSHNLQQPNFNDLWVRLEDTSFGPDSYFRRQQHQQQSLTPADHMTMTSQSHLTPQKSAGSTPRLGHMILLALLGLRLLPW